jgi:tetratricopeptide (TPR) repeat protein
MNAHVALQTNQPGEAKKFLDRLDPDEIPEDLQGRYYAMLGEAEVGLQDYEVALADLKHALQLFEDNLRATPLERERVRNWIGLAYYRQNKHFIAIEHHQRCLQAINTGQIRDRRFKLKIYYNLANEYHLTGNSQQALYIYQEAARLAEKGEDNFDLAGIYWGMGLAYRGLNELTRAKLFLGRSAELYESLGNTSLAFTVKSVLGQTLIERQDYAEAETVLKNVVEQSRIINNNTALALGYVNLAYLYREQQRYQEAEQNAEAGLKPAEEQDDKKVLAQIEAQLAECKLALKKFDEAIQYFDAAVQTLEQTEARDHLERIYFRYANALTEMGRMPQAVEYFRKAYASQRPPKPEV